MECARFCLGGSFWTLNTNDGCKFAQALCFYFMHFMQYSLHWLRKWCRFFFFFCMKLKKVCFYFPIIMLKIHVASLEGRCFWFKPFVSWRIWLNHIFLWKIIVTFDAKGRKEECSGDETLLRKSHILLDEKNLLHSSRLC